MDARAAELLELLVACGGTLATAESLTGGQLAARITSVPGASLVYRGGVVSYATAVKVDLLGVPTTVVEKDGVISPACAEAMADGARRVVGASYALSTTGVAGPDLQEGHPAGTVFVGVASPEGVRTLPLRLDGDRPAVQAATCEAALAALADVLRREHSGLG
ncbi:MAG: CinA family protein [Nocardioides sp.]|uniref:CinA family protein n=1 Tax=Nocardioides sp. TaxID=35761 RepID=UPI0039E2937A